MEFPYKEIACRPGGHAEAIAVEQKSRVFVVVWVFGAGRVPTPAEIRAILIEERETVEPGNGRLRHLKGVLASTESICHLVVSTWPMAKGERVVLQSFNPPFVPCVEFLLSVEESEGFVITVEGEFSMQKIMSPESQRLDDGVQLAIIVGVSTFGITELFTEVGDGV